jgi:hypothetical protein
MIPTSLRKRQRTKTNTNPKQKKERTKTDFIQIKVIVTDYSGNNNIRIEKAINKQHGILLFLLLL